MFVNDECYALILKVALSDSHRRISLQTFKIDQKKTLEIKCYICVCRASYILHCGPQWISCLRYREYYMVARRYEFYVRVARTISHEWAQRSSCHENIKFISSRYRVMFFLLYRHTDDGVFDDFPKISDHFPKIYKDFSKLFRKPDERSRTFSEDYRRLPKTIEEDPNMFRSCMYQRNTSISSLVRIWKIRHPCPGCSFVWILRVV